MICLRFLKFIALRSTARLRFEHEWYHNNHCLEYSGNSQWNGWLCIFCFVFFGGINYITTIKSGFHEWLPPLQLFFFKHPPICWAGTSFMAQVSKRANMLTTGKICHTRQVKLIIHVLVCSLALRQSDWTLWRRANARNVSFFTLYGG